MFPSAHEKTASVPHTLDVIVRFHDIAAADELRRCLFSLVNQEYSPLKVHLVTQRFSKADTSALEKFISPILAIDPGVEHHVWNYTAEDPRDARSALLNLGISQSQGRYLALLDHDDVIYPDAYSLLTAELKESRTAIAFGGIVAKTVDLFQDAIITETREQRFKGNNLLDLFSGNFCPIHSFVLDRGAINGEDLWFKEEMTRLEDYDFLLRITAKYPSSFRLVDRPIGDYYFKKDGSNTICVDGNESPQRLLAWTLARKAIAQSRSEIALSPTVQRMFGWSISDPELTIKKVLDRFK